MDQHSQRSKPTRNPGRSESVTGRENNVVVIRCLQECFERRSPLTAYGSQVDRSRKRKPR